MPAISNARALDRDALRFARRMSPKHRFSLSFVTFVTLASISSSLAGAAGCGESPAPEASGAAVEDAVHASCVGSAPTACATASAHYTDVAPIFQKSCNPCHGDDAPDGTWPLTGYGDVYPWASLIRQDLCANAMPPADGGIPIAASDRLAVLAWIQCGAPP